MQDDDDTIDLPDGYPTDLVRDLPGPGGVPYHLRAIVPGDADALVAFHRALSPHSVYMRFFTYHPTLSDAEVARFTTVDYHDRLALVVTHGATLVAVGRFDRPPGGTEAEVAFIVADEHQHHGLGSLLLDELAEAGRAHGVTSFKADTLAENHAMLDVFRHAGYPITSGVDYGTVTLRFPIALTDAARTARETREKMRRVPAGQG